MRALAPIAGQRAEVASALAADQSDGHTYDVHIDEEALYAWRQLLNAHARITARVERELAEAGLPPLSWYDVLWPLYGAPGRRLRAGALAEEVTISRTGLTRLVDRVERAGLLRREPAPEDRRGSYVVITRAGIQTLRKIWPVYEGVLDEVFATRLRDAGALARLLEPLGEP